MVLSFTVLFNSGLATVSLLLLKFEQFPLSLSLLHSRSPPQRLSPFSFAVTWSGSAIGVIFVCLSMTPSRAIVSSSAICRPSSSRRFRLRDQFVPYLFFLAWVSSRLSCPPCPGFGVKTVVCVHARRQRKQIRTSVTCISFNNWFPLTYLCGLQLRSDPIYHCPK